jgi:protein-tyrosine phosphatase
VDQYSIVFVCSGNRFRSPLAEAFVRRLTVGLPVVVRSFGTLRLGSAPTLPEASELGVWFGVDLSQHRARQLGSEPIGDADLLIGFDEEHVRRAVIDGNAPKDRGFAFRQIVSLAEQVEVAEDENIVQRARRVVEEAAALRAADSDAWRTEPFADPFGKSWRVYREAAVEIRELSLRLVAALFGVTETTGLPPLPPDVARRRPRRRR